MIKHTTPRSIITHHGARYTMVVPWKDNGPCVIRLGEFDNGLLMKAIGTGAEVLSDGLTKTTVATFYARQSVIENMDLSNITLFGVKMTIGEWEPKPEHEPIIGVELAPALGVDRAELNFLPPVMVTLDRSTNSPRAGRVAHRPPQRQPEHSP